MKMPRKRIDLNHKMDQDLDYLAEQYQKLFGVKPSKTKMVGLAIDSLVNNGMQRKPKRKELKW